ncbi:FecR family protein [Agrobacterium pusense]|jgi:transmembrane sensor|uniref:FecR family protein n=1 Tax=Agrobacterium pusense TaxID=648995 RepID=UPI0028B10D06|nr:FecR domain-containing protein [Agrobacterium pusense]
MSEISEERMLFREAADLAIRLQNDSANPVSLEMVRAWVNRSPAHEAAWAKVSAIHGMTGKILTDRKRAAQRESLGLTRRNLMIGGAIATGAIATGSWILPELLLESRADYRTSTAELKRVPLPDNSMVTLGPDSAIAIDFREDGRNIDLLAGMAYFEVIEDSMRPFIVKSGELSATALGTAFDVSSDAGVVSVSVDHGLVKAQAPGLSFSGTERLSAGEWLTFDLSSRGVVRGDREPFQIAAWRTGMIVAEKESVSALVAKISRWQQGKVIIADPFLRSRVVSGVFDLGDPLRALDAVVRPFGAKVRKLTPFVTVISPV